jgi:hypothetical protein
VHNEEQCSSRFCSRVLAVTEVSTRRIKSIRLPPGRRSSPRRCERGCSNCYRRNELLGDARFQSFNVEMLEEPSRVLINVRLPVNLLSYQLDARSDWQRLFTFRRLGWAGFHRRCLGWAFHFS